MKRSRRVIALNMFWSLLSLCINYLMNFLITPYVTNNIGVEAYGFVALANTFISYVDILAVGLNAFAGRFIAMAYYQKKLEKANRYFSSTILADLILACVLLAGGTVAIVRLDRMLQIPHELTADVKLLFFIVLMRYLLTLLRTAFDAAAFISERIDLAEKLQSAAYLLQAGLLLALCLLLQPHVWYVGLAAAVGALLLLAGNLRLCHKLTPELQFHVKDFSPHAVWEVLSTGSWTALNNLGNLLNSGLDLLITNLMLNATVMGQISVAKSLETIVSGMIMKISTVFRPRCLRLYAEDKMEELTGLLKISMRCTGGFCNLVVMGFFVCGHDFMALWLPGQNTDFLFRAGLIVLLSDIATGAVQPLYYVYTLTQKLRLPCCVTILMGTANGAVYVHSAAVYIGRRVCSAPDDVGDQRSTFRGCTAVCGSLSASAAAHILSDTGVQWSFAGSGICCGRDAAPHSAGGRQLGNPDVQGADRSDCAAADSCSDFTAAAALEESGPKVHQIKR